MSKQAATGPHVLRQMNVAAVLGALRKAGAGGTRVTDLAAETGLSRPAVTRGLAELIERGLAESGSTTNPGAQMGRPAQYVRFRAEYGHVAGVDIGPHHVRVLIADLSGTVLGAHHALVPPDADGQRLFETTKAALTAATVAASIDLSDLWAVTVGTPGIVDEELSKVLIAPSIPGWAALPVVPLLRTWLHCPVHIDNDVNLAVLAELGQSADGQAVGTMVYVHWGERIGTGVVIEGRPYRGTHGAAGELGFIDLGPDEPEGGSPADGMGAFERQVGAAAVRQLARDAGLPVDDNDCIAGVFDAASSGDPAAAAVVDAVAARFVRGLATLVLLMDPGLIVIGGGVSRAGEVLLEPLRRKLARRTLTPVTLRTSTAGERAVALGAVQHALGATEDRLTASPEARERPHPPGQSGPS
ncbi:ROK family transcriptional regulator [Streptomyces sp. NPDC056401]|uniref:ROK family transcriptional regulator n=1 Tax=Streptomyces sp. NPDC056401 TaxID=3345809 RepID=UPI0035DF29AB